MTDDILVLPPRSRGTATELRIGYFSGRFVYLNNRHENIKQTYKILESLDKNRHSEKFSIHIIGRNRFNELMNCPRDNTIYTSVLTPSMIIDFAKSLNKHPYDVSVSLMKYNPNVNVLTVPQIAWREIDPEQFDILAIDEDRTIDLFYPDDVEIFKLKWNKKGFQVEVPVADYIDNCPSSIKKGYPEFIEWLEQLSQLKNPEVFTEYYKEAKQNGSPHPYIDALEMLINDLPELPFTSWSLDEKIQIAEEFLRKGWREEEYNIVELFVASLFFRHYYMERQKKTEKSIYLVAERVLLFKNWLNKFKRIIIRGNDRAKIERFMKELGRDYQVLQHDKFTYASNFIIVKTDILEIAKILYKHNIPFLVYTGSKEKAEEAKKVFRKHGITNIDIADENTPIEQVARDAVIGRNYIFYANSSISRGLDLPFYDVILVWN